MSTQFFDRLEILLNQSRLADNPLGLDEERITKIYTHDLYTPKEVITFLKHFFFNNNKESVSNLTPLQILQDLTVKEFHTHRDDVSGQQAMEDKIMRCIE
jgi:hypothetical protein